MLEGIGRSSTMLHLCHSISFISTTSTHQRQVLLSAEHNSPQQSTTTHRRWTHSQCRKSQCPKMKISSHLCEVCHLKNSGSPEVCNFVRRHKAKQMTDANTWQFRRVLYSVPVTILVEDNEDTQFFHAVKVRRDIMKMATLVRRSGSQVVDEIMSLVRAHSQNKKDGKATAQSILKLYQDNLGDSGKENDNDDPSIAMTLSMVQSAMIIQKQIKDVAAINAVMIDASETLLEKSPFFTITNLSAMAKKSKTNEELQWIMEMMFDTVLLVQQSWTIRKLSPKNATGILDIILFQRDLKVELLEKALTDVPLPAEQKAKIKKCLSSPSELRSIHWLPKWLTIKCAA